jgi:hypothetical protein
MADHSTLRDQQYRPVSTAETSTNDGLSVRGARDLAMGANNAMARACAPMICDCWPGQQFWDVHNDTDEHILWRAPSWWLGRGHYSYLSWAICAYKASVANDVTYQLYSCEEYYRGPDTITDALKYTLGRYSSDSTVITATTGSCDCPTKKDAILLHTNSQGFTYLLMTVQFAAAAASNTTTLLSFAATASRKISDVQT